MSCLVSWKKERFRIVKTLKDSLVHGQKRTRESGDTCSKSARHPKSYFDPLFHQYPLPLKAWKNSSSIARRKNGPLSGILFIGIVNWNMPLFPANPGASMPLIEGDENDEKKPQEDLFPISLPASIQVKNRRKRYLDTHPEYFSSGLELAGPLAPLLCVYTQPALFSLS